MTKLFSFLLPVVFLAVAGPVFGQKKIKEGIVKYEISEIDSDNPQMAMMKGTRMDVYFAGEKQKVAINMMGGLMEMTVIQEGGEDAKPILLTNMAGNKIKVVQDVPEDVTEGEGIEFETKKEDKKKIAGFDCYKVIMTNADGDKVDIYVTEKIQPEKNYFQKMFPALNGFPLEYQINAQGIVMTYTAMEVTNKVADNAFDVPEGYTEMTQEEFQKEMGGMGGMGF